MLRAPAPAKDISNRLARRWNAWSVSSLIVERISLGAAGYESKPLDADGGWLSAISCHRLVFQVLLKSTC
jgi:hypothetical protein